MLESLFGIGTAAVPEETDYCWFVGGEMQFGVGRCCGTRLGRGGDGGTSEEWEPGVELCCECHVLIDWSIDLKDDGMRFEMNGGGGL